MELKNDFVKNRYNKDPIVAICKLKVHSKINGAIRDIGIEPFFVYNGTNPRLQKVL